MDSPPKLSSEPQPTIDPMQEPVKPDPPHPSPSEPTKPSTEPNDGAVSLDRGTNLSASSSKSVDAEPPRPISKQMSLQMQISTLESLQSRLKNLRGLPAHLMVFHSQSPLLPLSALAGLGIELDSTTGPEGTEGADPIASLLTGDTSMTQSQRYASQARSAFRIFNEISDVLRKDSTQEALKFAHQSEAQDKSEISLAGRRERKRRRGPAADSPAPYPSFQLQSTNIFPTTRLRDSKISNLDDLHAFIRDFNEKSRKDSALREDNPSIKLSIWEQSRSRAATRHVSDPLVVRMAIPDVTTLFVKLTFRSKGAVNGPVVLSLVAIGPREKKSPHSHSDFTVFQKLTQQTVGMLEKEPGVSFEQVVVST